MKLSVIIPAYNELDTIEESIARVRTVTPQEEIIVVDDCSTDGTREVLAKIPDIKLILHDHNQGKGKAIRTALEHVTGDIVIIHDADLEYYPEDIPSIIRPILEGKADVVYGSRFLKSRPTMRFANYLANKLLAFAANLLFKAGITDEATCYKAFRTSVIKAIPLTCMRFEFCPEVTAKLRRRGIRIHEVPIKYTARSFGQGKKIGMLDGIVAMWTLIKYRLRE
ncbi:MAG: glycosyltransferase family 2 protein [Armatimonadota bacterium]